MRLLLDTHALLWWLAGDEQLTKTAQAAIGDTSNEVIVSAASAWEITTKHRLGKLPGVAAIASDLQGAIADQGFVGLSIITARSPARCRVHIATPSTGC
jgi:PIN domain nuclease of toxin-antitoxin system